jgi:hypothetical protein
MVKLSFDKSGQGSGVRVQGQKKATVTVLAKLIPDL